MGSILTPGWSHQELPSCAASECVFTRRCRSTWNTYGYSDGLDRNSLGTVCINSHDTILSLYFQIIWTVRIFRGNICDPVSVAVKVIQNSIDPFACIFCISVSGWVNVSHKVLGITYKHPSCGVFTTGIQITVYTVFLPELVCQRCIISQIVPAVIILSPSTLIQSTCSTCQIQFFLVTDHCILVHFSFMGCCRR